MVNTAGELQVWFASGTCLTTGELCVRFASGKRGPGRTERGHLPLANARNGSPAVDGPAGIPRSCVYHWPRERMVRQW